MFVSLRSLKIVRCSILTVMALSTFVSFGRRANLLKLWKANVHFPFHVGLLETCTSFQAAKALVTTWFPLVSGTHRPRRISFGAFQALISCVSGSFDSFAAQMSHKIHTDLNQGNGKSGR